MKKLKPLLAGSVSVLALGASPAIAQEVFDLGEIVITATANPIERNRAGASIDVLETSDIDASQTSRLSETLDRLPGVSVVQNGPTGTAAELRIRGSSERYTAVFIDGIKVNDPSSTSGQFGNFGTANNTAISRIEVLKGSQSALYGGSAVAGVINIFTLPGPDTPEGISQRAEFLAGSEDTFLGSYSIVQKQDRWVLNFGASYTESDGFSAAERDNGNSEDDGFNEYRLNFGVAYELTDQVTVGVNGFYTNAEFEFDEFNFEPEDGTPDEEGTRDSKGLRLYAEIDGDTWDQNIALSYFRVDRTAESPTVGPGFAQPFDSDFQGERTRLDYSATTNLSDQIELTLGGDYQNEEAEYDNLTAGSEDIDIWGVFAEAVYSATPDLDLIGTIRHDDHSSFGGETTGRLAFSYRQSEQLTLRGAIATGYRPPTIDELYGVYPGGFPFAGNPDLDPEESTSYELGADYIFASGAQVSATAFRTEIDDLITFQNNFPGVSTLVNVSGESTRQGVELGASVPINDMFELFGAYTYLDTEDADGERLQRIPRHDLLLGARAALTNELDAQLVLNHVANRPDDNGQEMDDYTVVNASISYKLTDLTEAFLRVENVFDEDYQTIAGYSTPERSFFVGVRAAF